MRIDLPLHELAETVSQRDRTETLEQLQVLTGFQDGPDDEGPSPHIRKLIRNLDRKEQILNEENGVRV